MTGRRRERDLDRRLMSDQDFGQLCGGRFDNQSAASAAWQQVGRVFRAVPVWR
jgi:hypothetical protein